MQKARCQQGYALVSALFVLVVCASLVAVMSERTDTGLAIALEEAYSMQAYYAAESGFALADKRTMSAICDGSSGQRHLQTFEIGSEAFFCHVAVACSNGDPKRLESTARCRHPNGDVVRTASQYKK